MSGRDDRSSGSKSKRCLEAEEGGSGKKVEKKLFNLEQKMLTFAGDNFPKFSFRN